MADRIIYKNHCTPQEKLGFAAGDRWYLDSDCGRKLTGSCISKSTAINTPVTGTFASTLSVSTDSDLGSAKFIHVRNTDTSGSDYLLIEIGGRGARIKLSPGESFSSDLGTTLVDTIAVIITASGTPDYEYIVGT